MDFRILGLFTGIYSHHLRKSADDLQVVLNCLLRRTLLTAALKTSKMICSNCGYNHDHN